MLQKYKTIIIVVVVVVILFLLYAFFFKKDVEPALSVTAVDPGTISAENNELIMLLTELKSIHLDKDVFTDRVFLSLLDFSVILIPEPVSRPNPFAPIGSDGPIPQVSNQTDVDIDTGP